jgi:hypothetical protein
MMGRNKIKLIMTRYGTGVVLLLFAISFVSGQTPTESGTGIEGVITISPIHPGPVREGMSGSAPLANCDFTVANEKGPVTSFTTDAQGHFRIALAPGHYTISAGRKIGMHGCGPFDVDVTSGKMTSVQWECDTGIR